MEIELLSRLAINHLFLAQFEPFRAIILTLYRHDPPLALSILHSVIFHASSSLTSTILWSASCSSPSLLSWLSSLLLLQLHATNPDPESIEFQNRTVSSLNPESLRLRSEFLLHVHIIKYRISNFSDSNSDVDTFNRSVLNKGFEGLSVLDRIEYIGFKRLMDDIVAVSGVEGDEERSVGNEIDMVFNREELFWLRKAVLEHRLADIFDAICLNIKRQVNFFGSFDSVLDINVENNGKKGSQEDFKDLGLILTNVQAAHLGAIEESVKVGDMVGAISHIRFLHLDYGLPETQYRTVLQDVLKKVLSEGDEYIEAWCALQKNLLKIYVEALSSNSMLLVQLIQAIQDELFRDEIREHRDFSINQILPPLQRLLHYIHVTAVANSSEMELPTKLIIRSSFRDLYHYARVSGLHLLEYVIDTAMSAIRKEDLQGADNVLILFPRLRPLVAVMGWDILSGKTTARKTLMQLLWIIKSHIFWLEDSTLDSNKSDEVSCIDYLCDSLCYYLDLASFVAYVNSGKSWSSKYSLVFSGKEQLPIPDAQSDSFVENLVLERLSVQSPLRVLFDVVPSISFEKAIELINLQPIASTNMWKRKQDIELVHMRYAIESTVFALGAIGRSICDDTSDRQLGLCHLKDLQKHMDAVINVPRKVFLVNMIISLLHIDDISLNYNSMSSENCSEIFSIHSGEHTVTTIDYSVSKLVVSCIGLLLEILHNNLPLALTEHEVAFSPHISTSGWLALEWRISTAKKFIEDWEWRLSMLQHLLPLCDCQWRWKETLTLLHAAPSMFLNFCMQRAKYDVGEEAVHRYSLSQEDKATLELFQWVDRAFKSAAVENAVCYAADGTSPSYSIDFSSLRSQIGPVAAILLCIDVAAASARSANISQQLLNQAQVMLSEIYPGGSPKVGITYWDQVYEVGVISVTRRLVRCLLQFLEQDNPPALQTVLLGHVITETSRASHWQNQRDRALALLHQMIEDAHKGRRQFLSGKLHNLARAISDEEKDANLIDGSFSEIRVPFNFDNVVVGLGLKSVKHFNSSSNVGEVMVPPTYYDMNDSGKKILGPVNSKFTTYLSQFILHIAAIGDIVDGADTTHDFNFFSLIYEWPKDILIRLVFDQGSTDAAGKVAGILSSDFLHEVISACVPPVVPPKSGHGWASIPVIPSYSCSGPEFKVAPPSLKELKPNCYNFSSVIPGISLYPLKLDIVNHLVKLSPVRAVLACVFGSSMLSGANHLFASSCFVNGLHQSTDVDRLFYEFALDQSDRFPTLNRWIQMQTNLVRVSEFVISPEHTTDIGKVKSKPKDGIKRMREFNSDTDSEIDDIVVMPSAPTNLLDTSNLGGACPDPNHSRQSEIGDHNLTVFLSFDWENEEPYEKAVECLIDEGKLMDALALSDRFLRNGASDHLLQLIIEHGAENSSNSSQFNDYGDHSIMGNSWQYCLRLKDKHLAAKLSLKHLHRWDVDAALDILTMCSCHLGQNDPVRNEVLQMRQALQRYNRILCTDDCYNSWQEVEADSTKDPEGLALRLAEKGAVSAALEVAESARLSMHLRKELQSRQLVKLLTADPLSGGGPAEASRFLSTIPGVDDVLPVVMGAMQLLPNLRSKQLLVHFFLKRRDGNLSSVEVSRLNSWALGLRVLASLPQPWQQRCSSLHEYPHLILEVLLMRKQLQSASLILKEFPSLRDDDLIIQYTAKAISVSVSPPSRGPWISISNSRSKQNTSEGAPTRSLFTNSFSKFQKEACRAFSWAPRIYGDKTVQQDSYRKRKSSELASSERTQWEALAGIHEDCVSSYAAAEQTQIPSASISEEWIISGDISKDEAVRSSHYYESAPDISLFKALLSLCSNELVSAKGALDLCVNQMKMVLSCPLLSKDSSMEIVCQSYHATETFVQGLLYSRSLLRKLCEGNDMTINSESCRNSDDASSDAFTSSIQYQTTNALSEVLSQAEIWLERAELLQGLLGTGIAVCLDDIADKDSSEGLRDRLILDERYSMAIYTCKKCKIDAFPVWNAWGHALIHMGHYPQARVKFKQAFQLLKGYPASVILDIINTIEGGPPVDVSAVRSMYNHLAKSAPSILDDSLSADSYFNVLHMLSTFPRSERSRRSLESASSESVSSADFEDGPHSNLDNVRYLECVNYLQEYGRPNLLDFMFRHGRYNDACMLFFPPNDIPSPPQPSSLPQKPDLLATDYGTIDNLCDLCIGYGSILILLEVVSRRMSCASQTDEAIKQHTDDALDRICTYCETHKHFNYLYLFQVLKKDHVASGLCCIQLYMNSDSQEGAIKHLEHAKMHFEEGLLARKKAIDSTKLVTKGIRGKNASEMLSEEWLVKFSARVSIQVDVLKCFNDIDGPQWKYSLFGNPDNPETFRRRCKIAEVLTEKNFDLAFQVIYEFNLPAVHIYAGVAASLAERKWGGQLTEFFRNIKGTIDDDDWDQVLGTTINVFANRHKERPDRLIDMLTSSHRKVLACVVCGRLKSAFQIASKSGSVADVQYVAHQALHSNALPILDMCKQWLAQCM